MRHAGLGLELMIRYPRYIGFHHFAGLVTLNVVDIDQFDLLFKAYLAANVERKLYVDAA
jgi:hypothetical protein